MLTTIVVCLMSSLLVLLFTSVDPYMDEIFHIPQAKEYCNGNFDSWDPKITTFPGLYIISSMLPFVVKKISGYNFCGTFYLRCCNFVFSMLYFAVAVWCRKLIAKSTIDALTLANVLYFYPPVFFYHFLYYTDTLSVLSLLALYAYAIQNVQARKEKSVSLRSHCIMILLSSVCILSRQTNALWVLFVAGVTILSEMERKEVLRDNQWDIHAVLYFIRSLFVHFHYIASVTWSLLLPVFAFVLFIVYNGSIVVGDKGNHQMVLHLAMPLHFLVIVSLIMAPVHIFQRFYTFNGTTSEVQPSARVSRRSSFLSAVRWGTDNAFLFFAVNCVVGWILWSSCYSHPFLLADNRHLTFYIWRYILSKPVLRLVLTPVYSTAVIHVYQTISQCKGLLWMSIYSLALGITLIPAHLLELRYFTPGVVVLLLNIPQVTQRAWTLVVVAFVVVDVALLYIFLYRSFLWPDGSLARFML